VLDLVPVRADQSTGDALAATVSLARSADDLGYRRYWLAEHHNMPAVAATNPAVLIAMVAGATERIRVGSGGVMLPNHAPLVVAEQFALLEAAHPGRIDLGIGRAPGSDPVTSWAHHFSGQGTAEALAAYRREFRPSDAAAEPTTFLTVNVCVAETREEALALARPQLLAMVALRTSGALRPQLSVEAAAAETLPSEHEALAAAMLERWVVGTPEEARERLLDLAATYGVDEVMVHPVAGSREGADRRRAETRERTLELLAGALAGHERVNAGASA
jgi:alkanesulfonate monooxygenase SsuD/methylene tetrahydromethanopterin reductase-like flavin-dependent oxidoreductase (luciferase family)